MTGIAMMQTTKTFDVSPIPYTITRSGMRAASGAACMTMKIGRNSQSNQELSPIQRPRAIPRKAEINNPTASGRSVSM